MNSTIRPLSAVNTAKSSLTSSMVPRLSSAVQSGGGLPLPSLSMGSAIQSRPSKRASRIPQWTYNVISGRITVWVACPNFYARSLWGPLKAISLHRGHRHRCRCRCGKWIELGYRRQRFGPRVDIFGFERKTRPAGTVVPGTVRKCPSCVPGFVVIGGEHHAQLMIRVTQRIVFVPIVRLRIVYRPDGESGP